MLPHDPFALAATTPAFEPAARRVLELHGSRVELCWIPTRSRRAGRAHAARPPFPPCRAEQILDQESLWSADGVALTPNIHPFAARHLLLWSQTPRREPDGAFLRCGFEMAERSEGTLLLNSIGAAASIPWLHGHLLGEKLDYLERLPTEPVDAMLGPGVDVRRIGAPFPAFLLAVSGPIEAVAPAVEDLLRRRTTPAFSLVYTAGRAFVMPRSIETPAPDFPQALGSAELWGRWCFEEESAFASANPESLDRALRRAGLAT
ncbi:MAG: hypothetical protein ACO3UM_06660 [Planctomycetota bacterium]